MDHKYTKVMLYCPRAYSEMLTNTFELDDKVFKQMNISLKEAERKAVALLPRAVREQCPWAFRSSKGEKQVVVPLGYPRRRMGS